MSLTKSEINKEARSIIKDVFHVVWDSKDKDSWKRCIAFIDEKIIKLENGDRGENMFFYWQVHTIMIKKFGDLFVKNKVCTISK